jgi:glycosyltransferase involved in cell wall biosynthesis
VKKKLLVIIGSLEVGGTERHLVSFLPKLYQYGWTIEVLTLAKKGMLAPNLEKCGVIVTSLLTPGHFKWIEKLPRLLGRLLRISLCVSRLTLKLKKEKGKESLLHFYLPESYVLGMFAASLARFSGQKIMSRRSLNDYQSRRPGIAWCEKKLHTKTSLILGNSKAILTQLKEQEGVPEERLRLIYNGVDMESFPSNVSRNKIREETRQCFGVPKNAFVMVKVANLIPYKGHKDLLNALNIIQNKLPQSWRLLCIGRDDGIGQALKQQAEQFGLKEHVLWLGSRQDVPNLLVSADVGILCSHEEGFSNAILEGMAAGLPMVVTDVGGNKEAVINEQTGYVVPAKDMNALSGAILQCANHLDQAIVFGQRGRLRIVEHFSLEACVNAYVRCYEALLYNHPLPAI